MSNWSAVQQIHSVYFENMGCRLNQAETLALESNTLELGYKVTRDPEKADFVVINTCTVTNRADGKNRSVIRKLKGANPGARIIVTGCYATTDKEKLDQMEEVDLVVSNGEKFNITDYIQGKNPVKTINKFSFAKQTPHRLSRGYIKIQDGCNKRCSYCKIPLARGRAESRPLEDIIKEAQYLESAGFAEVVLTGVNIGSYRYSGADFHTVLERLLGETDLLVRISSIEPDDITDGLIELFQGSNLAKFLHLPVQSGSNTILKQMRRNYTVEEFISITEKLKAKVPGIHIGTDLIYGFPGESDNEFQETVHMLSKVDFANIHLFPFSRRSGSPIEGLLDKKDGPIIVNGNVMKKRSAVLSDLAQRSAQNYVISTAGQRYYAIVEKVAEQKVELLSENYIRGELPIDHGRLFRKGEKVYIRYDRNGTFTLLDTP